MLRVTLLTSTAQNYWPMVELTTPNRREYCEWWNIRLDQRQQKQYEPWGERNEHMLDALAGCDWLMFMDSDTVITNLTIDCRQFCDQKFDVVVSHDRLGLNNGVFFLRNCLMGREFLRGVLDRRGKDVHDQQAMRNVMATMPELKVGLVPQRSMNSYLYEEYPTIKADETGQWQPGDFILHLPGLNFERRMKVLREYLGRVVR